jgi:hypothetical protein
MGAGPGHRRAKPLPWRLIESEAVERIDELRREAVERDHAPRGSQPGRVVMERIEGGRVVQFLAPHGRRGLVRREI